MSNKIEELASQLAELVRDTTKIQPKRDRVLVKDLKEKLSTIIHVVHEEKASKGVVVATGPGIYSDKGELIPNDVSPGDIVLFNKHSGSPLEIEGEEVRMIKAADILASLE